MCNIRKYHSFTRFLVQHDIMISTLMGCLGILLVLISAECAFRLKNWVTKPATIKEERTSYYTLMTSDPVLSFRPKASASFNDRFVLGGKEIYNAIYKTDANGYRVTPQKNETSHAYNAVFLGCSFTFGLGLNQNETMPARFAEKSSSFAVTNAACPGWGPQNTWLLLQEQQFYKTLPMHEGLAFYVYFGDHLARLTGEPQIILAWEKPLPWLTLDNGKLQHQGNFYDRSPLRYALIRYIPYSHVARFVQARVWPGLTTPMVSTEEAEAMLIAFFNESAERLKMNRPKMQFCVITYPFSAFSEKVITHLKASNISIFDYSQLIADNSLASEEYWFPDGANGKRGHPRLRLNEIIAEQLAKDVAIQFPEYTPSPPQP